MQKFISNCAVLRGDVPPLIVCRRELPPPSITDAKMGGTASTDFSGPACNLEADKDVVDTIGVLTKLGKSPSMLRDRNQNPVSRVVICTSLTC